jgi:hypothetical protein
LVEGARYVAIQHIPSECGTIAADGEFPIRVSERKRSQHEGKPHVADQIGIEQQHILRSQILLFFLGFFLWCHSENVQENRFPS